MLPINSVLDFETMTEIVKSGELIYNYLILPVVSSLFVYGNIKKLCMTYDTLSSGIPSDRRYSSLQGNDK